MKSKIFYLIPLCLLALVACRQQTKKVGRTFLSFDSVRIYPYPGNYISKVTKGWFSDSYKTKADTLNRYDGQTGVLIQPTDTGKVETFFYMYNRDIVGKKITFSGKYKYKQAQHDTVRFSVKLDTYQRETVSEETVRVCDGESDWQEFSVEMPFPRTERFYFRIVASGDFQLWVSDCQVEVDGQSFDILENPTAKADKDIEFAAGSRIALKNVSAQTRENLEVLGKVWGFLKYFHPAVTAGNYNWDFELFRILPQVADAADKEARNEMLSRWIDKYGEIEEEENYAVEDSSRYHRFARLEWLEDKDLFGEELSGKLVAIKNAKRNPVFNYYLVPLAGKEETEFTREKPYPDVSWEDQGYRLLTLFRMWNAVEYCFPYANCTDRSWSELLGAYLPEFLEPASEEELNRSILKLAAEMDDSNAFVHIPNQPRMKGLPLSLTVTDKGEYAVMATRLREIERGSVIVAVNGKPIEQCIADLRPITSASNEMAMRRKIAEQLFLTPEKDIEVTVEYKGKKKTMIVPTQTYTNKYEIGRHLYSLSSHRMIPFSMSTYAMNLDADYILKRLERYKGVVFDLRETPPSNAQTGMEKILYPKPTDFMWYSMNAKQYPGNYFLDIVGDTGAQDNPDYFKGKVIILVDEHTQNWGELTAIAYRSAPNSVVIGTQTAGATGHLGYLFLPRNIRLSYTMAGAFYPDWGMSQRDGVKIDIPVTQTVEDIEEGKDMWMEKVIEYVTGEM